MQLADIMNIGSSIVITLWFIPINNIYQPRIVGEFETMEEAHEMINQLKHFAGGFETTRQTTKTERISIYD